MRALPEASNLILYGPPGTGKTYETAIEAVKLCDGAPPETGRSAVMSRYKQLREAGRIEFVTFHQSYSYEDFVEGLRPETAVEEDGDNETPSTGFRLKPVDGVFKRIAALARQSGTAQSSGPVLDFTGRNFFKMSLGRADQSDVYRAAVDGGYIALDCGSDFDWSDPAYDSYDAILAKWLSIKPRVSHRTGDAVLCHSP